MNRPSGGPLRIWGTGCSEHHVDQGLLLEYERLTSTMDVARARLRDGVQGLVGVRTEYQTAGRGRTGSAWLAPPGACLLVTYVVPAQQDPDFARNLAFASGVAVAEAIEDASELSPRLKWPNDVLISGRKVAGVLIEEAATRKPSAQRLHVNTHFLVGIGVNVNVEAFPAELSEQATSIEIESGLLLDVQDLEERVRRRLFDTIELPWGEILLKWRVRDDTAGRRYRAPGPSGNLDGTAVGVTDDGLLRLETDDGVTDVLSASSIKTPHA